MRTLYVAAGGGGDAVGALLARRALGDTDERPPLVTTCAWERLRIDPVPGPRARSDFTGLGLVGGEPCEVLSTSDTTPPGRSVLPRLAETSGARIFLHDFEDGAQGLAAQLRRLASSLDVGRLVVVDVGGDIVAHGRETGLRSPLADSLTLAAALNSGVAATVVVLGPGADAELPERRVLTLLEGNYAELAGRIAAADVKNLSQVLSWHPTEASALVAASADGIRGAVIMRRGHTPVPVTACTSAIWAIRDPSIESLPLAQSLLWTNNLTSAEEIMRSRAVNEIDYERAIATDASVGHAPWSLEGLVDNMQEMGATHVSDRRLRETLGDFACAQVGVERPPAGLWSIDELRQALRQPPR